MITTMICKPIIRPIVMFSADSVVSPLGYSYSKSYERIW